MNRSSDPDPDPQRGPRRYGPNSSGRPPQGIPVDRPPAGNQREAWSEFSGRTAVQSPGVPGAGWGGPAVTQTAQTRTGRPEDYRSVPPVDRPPHRTHAAIVAGRIIAAVLSVAVLAGFGFAWGFASKATSQVATGAPVGKAGQAGVLFRGGQNILLIGSDARTDQQGNPLSAAELAAVSTQDDGGGVNTDTIMVVHIPQGGGKATAVSLPRDTWIPQSVTDIVKGPYSDGTSGPYKPNKINSFYSSARFYTQEYDVSRGVKDAAARERNSDNAGRTELQAIVQAFTGLHIDHYAEVNLIGFYTLSNAIGGVPVCLNEAVDDPFSGANFKAGPQEVAGSAAMSFVRQRHGLPGGDLDRVRRQQAFLAGATSKMLSAGVLTSPSKLSSLMQAASRSLVLDSGFDLLTFAGQMADLSGGNVTFQTIPTHGAQASAGSDALATDPAEIKSFFAAINGKAATAATTAPSAPSATAFDPASITVDVQNAAKIDNLAAAVSSTLVRAGFKAGDITTYPGITSATVHQRTTISYPTGARTAAAAVQKALGGKGTLVSDDSISAGHISVAAGRDMQAPSGLRSPGILGLAAGATNAGATAPTTGSPPAKPITAASVGCVN